METSRLIRTANQMTGFCIDYNTVEIQHKLEWVNVLNVALTVLIDSS